MLIYNNIKYCIESRQSIQHYWLFQQHLGDLNCTEGKPEGQIKTLLIIAYSNYTCNLYNYKHIYTAIVNFVTLETYCL